MKSTLRTLSLSVTLMALVACGGKSVEEQIASAQQYLDAGDYKSANIELKGALQKEGSSAQARWLLGTSYLLSGDAPSAEKEILRAEKLGWDINDIRPALATALFEQGKYAELMEVPHDGLPSLPAAELLSTKALGALALSEVSEAESLAAKAFVRDPDLREVRMAKVHVLNAQGKHSEALIILKELLEESPEDALGWSLQGNILLQQSELAEAADSFSKALELSPDNFSDRLKRSLIELQIGNFDAARADADILVKAAPHHPATNYINGLLLFREGKYTEATTALTVAEPIADSFPMIMFYLGSAHLLEGDVDQSATYAKYFVERAPENIAGRKLLATVRLQQGRNEEVLEALQPVLDSNPDDVGALNLMANALLRSDETEQGIELLARIAKLQPDSPVAQVRLGAGLLLTGQGDSATQHMEAALELNPEFQQAEILLVMNHLQRGNFEAAEKASKEYLEHNPNSTAPHNVLGRVYLAMGDPESAKESFEMALNLDPGDPSANQNLAQMAIAAGDVEAARKRYQTTIQHYPDSLPTLMQLAMLEASQNNEAALQAHLRKAMAAHPEALEPRLFLGRYLLSKGKPEQVPPLFADLKDMQKNSPQVLRLIASAQLRDKQHNDALYTLEQLTSAQPDSPDVHHMIAMAAAGKGDTARMKKELQKAHDIDKTYLPSLIALARLSWSEQAKAEFEQYMQQLVELAPESSEVLRLSAADASQKGKQEEALRLSHRAYDAAPSTVTVLELAAYETQAGNLEASLDLKRDWIAANPSDVPVHLALAEQLQSSGDITLASQQYLNTLILDPGNLIALNNLAWNLRKENPEQALQYIERAAEVAPDRPEVLDTLAVVAYINGDQQKAMRNIRRALDLSPDNPSMLYHLAMIQASMGNTLSAKTTLNALLAADAPNFPEKSEASALLDSLSN